MNLCAYKDLFGIPGQGIHERRFAGMALMDWIQTIFGSACIAYLFNISFWKVFLAMVIIGEWLHYIFCVDTPVVKFIKRILQS